MSLHFYSGWPQDDFTTKPLHVTRAVSRKECLLIKVCLSGWKVFLLHFKTHGGMQCTTKIISPEAAFKTTYPESNESNSVGF